MSGNPRIESERKSVRELLPDAGQDGVGVLVGARNDLDADHLADAARRGGAGIDGRLDGGDVAGDAGGEKAAADLPPAQELDVGGLQPGVARLDQSDQALGLDYAQGF